MFPAMIEPDGSMGNLIVAVTGVVITMVIAFAATMILYKEPKVQAVPEGAKDKPAEKKKDSSMIRITQIASPMRGEVLSLSAIKDEAFASGVLGKGAAIRPEEGAELLIHIGLDTVQLNGEGFERRQWYGITESISVGRLFLR